MTAFCHQHGDSRARYCRRRWDALQPLVPIDQRVVATYERQIPLLAELLLGLVQQKQQSIRQLQQLFTQHPDHEIFASLPGAGDLLAPKLLVMFGDHRHRLPSAAVIQSLAGTCPVTIRSGQRRSVRFDGPVTVPFVLPVNNLPNIQSNNPPGPPLISKMPAAVVSPQTTPTAV